MHNRPLWWSAMTGRNRSLWDKGNYVSTIYLDKAAVSHCFCA